MKVETVLIAALQRRSPTSKDVETHALAGAASSIRWRVKMGAAAAEINQQLVRICHDAI